MLCPKCEKEILDGHMYCSDCGYEINLVPEFEAKVEEHISENIQSVVDKAELMDKDVLEQTDSKKERLFYISGTLIAVLVFLLVSASVAAITFWKQSTFVQEMLVEYYIDDENYDQAIDYLEETVKKDSKKISLRFKLCELYMSTDRVQDALGIYDEIANDEQYNFEERVAAIEQLVNYYAQKKQYKWIASYLSNLDDEKMQMAFLDYMVVPVEFSQTEGAYTSLITLKLTSNAIGTIYYTTDGTKPTKHSNKFMNTIFLEAGENVISAMFVNDYGVQSDVVTKEYFIESKRVSPPEVLTYSGTYNCPVKLNIEKEYNTRIYYTTDGSAPNRNSNLYSADLYLPIGKSTYKFIAIDSRGEVSEIVTRDYEVRLDTTLTVEEAKALLIEYLISKGEKNDAAGHIMKDDTHILIYEYLYPMSVEVGTDCYYFAEVLRDITTNEQSRTNCFYGVDIRTNKVYVLSQ